MPLARTEGCKWKVVDPLHRAAPVHDRPIGDDEPALEVRNLQVNGRWKSPGSSMKAGVASIHGSDTSCAGDSDRDVEPILDCHASARTSEAEESTYDSMCTGKGIVSEQLSSMIQQGRKRACVIVDVKDVTLEPQQSLQQHRTDVKREVPHEHCAYLPLVDQDASLFDCAEDWPNKSDVTRLDYDSFHQERGHGVGPPCDASHVSMGLGACEPASSVRSPRRADVKSTRQQQPPPRPPPPPPPPPLPPTAGHDSVQEDRTQLTCSPPPFSPPLPPPRPPPPPTLSFCIHPFQPIVAQSVAENAGVAEAAKHRRRVSIAERAGVGYDVPNMEISNLQISGIALDQGHAGAEQDTQGEHMGNARKILSRARGENEEQPSGPRGGAQAATIGATIRSPALDVSVARENSPAVAEGKDAQNLFTTTATVGARVSALWTPTLETEAAEDADDVDKYEEYFEENGETEQIDCKADKESHTGAGRSPQGKDKKERAAREVEAHVKVPRDISLEFSNSPLLVSPILPPSQTLARARVMGLMMKMGCSAPSAASLDPLSVSSSFCDHKRELHLEMTNSGYSFLEEEGP
jgi:hypothetical protein